MNFFPTSVNVDILNSSHKSQTFLMASIMVNCFQKVFNWLCPDPWRNHYLRQQNCSLIHVLQNKNVFSSVTQSCPTLLPYWLQLTRPPCPSPTPRAYSNSCPLSRWRHPTISSSIIPFSSFLQSCPASGSFQMSQFFKLGGQSIGVSASASVLPMDIQDWFPLGRTGWISLQNTGLSRVFSNTTDQKHQFFGAQLSL